MNAEQQKQDLVVTRVFDAPVDALWKAWTDSDTLKQWWGPNGFTCPLAEMDVQVGGKSLVGMSSPDFGTHYSLWDYQAIDPQARIDFIHNLADQDGNKIDPVAVGMPADFPTDQLQVIAFKSLGDNKTELTVTEYGWTVGQMMEMSRMGMNQCLDKLERLLAADH
ncbi:MAG: SRPBCC domain-containing protein [Aggregatilineales bacterium]